MFHAYSIKNMGRQTCSQKQQLKKGLWTPEEDEKLINHITKFGHGCWISVPKQAGNYGIKYIYFCTMYTV
jgi:Myb-like DNA-binding domain